MELSLILFLFSILFRVLKIVKLIQWLSIIIGAGGTAFSAYMHFKIQNVVTVVPIQKVEEKEDAKAKNNNKVTIHEILDPVKLTKQSETNKNPKKTENK